MGLYIFISEQDRVSKRTVADLDVNEAFQLALQYDPSLMIEQYEYTERSFFKTKTKNLFNVYHETPAHDGTAYQAITQMSASGERAGVIAYLHGIINGALAKERNLTPVT